MYLLDTTSYNHFYPIKNFLQLCVNVKIAVFAARSVALVPLRRQRGPPARRARMTKRWRRSRSWKTPNTRRWSILSWRRRSLARSRRSRQQRTKGPARRTSPGPTCPSLNCSSCSSEKERSSRWWKLLARWRKIQQRNETGRKENDGGHVRTSLDHICRGCSIQNGGFDFFFHKGICNESLRHVFVTRVNSHLLLCSCFVQAMRARETKEEGKTRVFVLRHSLALHVEQALTSSTTK